MKNKIKKSIIVIALHHFWFRARIDVELLQRATNRESFEKNWQKIGILERWLCGFFHFQNTNVYIIF
jgi:hypothetical protein